MQPFMVLLACLLALLMFVPAVPAFAEGLNDGRVLFGEDFTLESGEELDGDLAALIAITICLLPMPFFVAVATLAAVLFGWTAVGLLVGQRLLAALKVQETNQLVAVLVGVLLISLLTAVPCLGWLFAVVVGSLGLGAVVLTRFGTMAYPPAPAPIASAEPRETE